MAVALRWTLAAAIAVTLTAVPYFSFRCRYAHHKRLLMVDAGRLYRSGQMTAEGFRDAVRQLGIKTVVNVQDDFPDPDLDRTYWDRRTVKESALCRELGVKYVFLAPDLAPNRCDPHARPQVLDEWLAVMDDPANWPVLLHCKAGLHRTGVLAAAYRMEYQGWSPQAAFREASGLGYGNWSAANDYVQQYVLNFRPRERKVVQADEPPSSAPKGRNGIARGNAPGQ
jgi:tyrosine-protein phosphatase SIW14